VDTNEVTHWITAKRERLLIRDMESWHLQGCKILLERKTKVMSTLTDYKKYGKCRAYTKSPEYKAICKELDRRMNE